MNCQSLCNLRVKNDAAGFCSFSTRTRPVSFFSSPNSAWAADIQTEREADRERGSKREAGEHNISYISDLLPWHVALSSDLRRMSEPTIIYNTHSSTGPRQSQLPLHCTALHCTLLSPLSLLPFWTPFLPSSARFRFVWRGSLIRSCRTIKCIAPAPFWHVRQVAT